MPLFFSLKYKLNYVFQLNKPPNKSIHMILRKNYPFKIQDYSSYGQIIL